MLYTGQYLYIHIALLFSSLVTHSIVAYDLAFSTMTPVPKTTNSPTVSANYWAIITPGPDLGMGNMDSCMPTSSTSG